MKGKEVSKETHDKDMEKEEGDEVQEEDVGEEEGKEEEEKEEKKDIEGRANAMVLLERSKPLIQLTIPELHIEGEFNLTVAHEPLPFQRKVQICCTGEKLVLSFYWKKMARRSDEILLVHVIRDNKTEAEAEKEREMYLNLAEGFKKECKLQGVFCQYIFPVGKPGEVLCDVATQFKPHFIMIGSKRNKKHKSVSKHVLHNSSAPVLMVPATRGHLGRGFSTVAAVAQAAVRFGMNSETKF